MRHLSNPSASNSHQEKKGYVRKEDTLQNVLEYAPKKFELGIPKSAQEVYEREKNHKNDFKISETIKIQVGLDKLSLEEDNENIEKLALDKLKEVQESAYQQAYSLGLEEGKKDAFESISAEISVQLKELEEAVKAIGNMKIELLKQNEAHLIKLTIHMATRLAKKEIEVDPACLVEIMRSSLESAQVDEDVSIHVSPFQLEFLEKIKLETGREYEFIKKIKFIPNETIHKGGCIIETNYGTIDARFEERVEKFWQIMSQNLYKIKNKIGAA
jgi:flagellar assembly protein FliH